MKLKLRKSFEVAPGIYRFDTGPFNWYVIEDEGRLTLVDAGFVGHYKVFVDGIISLGFEMKDLEAIILTHAHADHIGFAEKLRKKMNVPVFIHKNDAIMASTPLQLPWYGLLSRAWRPFTASMLGHAIVNGVFTMPSIKKLNTFGDGQILDVPGRPLTIHTPGHTKGETAFYLPKRNVLFSGDTLITKDLFTGKENGPQLAHPLLNNDFSEAYRSLGLLNEIGEVIMLPGHGKPWFGEMRKAIDIAGDDIYIEKMRNTNK